MKIKMIFLSLMLFSTFTQAGDLPFVGEREFSFEGRDNPRVIRTIIIKKNGNMTLLYNYFGFGRTETIYQGKYKPVICDKDNDGDDCIKILNAKQVALVDKQGKILQECNIDNKPACISPLTKVSYHTDF